jgi:small subunit ribosomal protein S17
MAEEKKPKILKGVVVSDKMAKTRVVRVGRFKKARKYGKFVKSSKRFKAHDEKDEYKLGDKVAIQETRPMSREKRWKIIGKV